MAKCEQHRLRGFYGGTFDPIHQGHLQLALFVVDYCQLEQLELLPCHIPPHRAAPGSQSQHRAAMVKIAIADSPQLLLNELELRKDSPSFTVETLSALKKQYPNDNLCFLIGMDSLCSLTQWHQYQQIFKLAHLLVLQRPGYSSDLGDAPELLRQYQAHSLEELRLNSAGKILLLPNPNYPISATEIRQSYQKGEPLSHYQIPAVQQYIQQHQLYR